MTDLHISSLLPEIPTAELRPKIRNQRQYVNSLFVEALKNTKFKPSFICFRMSHLRLDELYAFYDQCCKAKSGFFPCWWGALNVDKPFDYKKKWNKINGSDIKN